MASYLGFGTLQFSGSLRVNDPFLGALCPSKSGLMNKHIVKAYSQTYRENILYRVVKHTVVLMSFGMGINYFQQFIPLY